MSEARIVSEWLAAGLAAEAAEAAEDEAITARLKAVPDPFADDFTSSDPLERVTYGLVTAEHDESLVGELDLDLAELAEFKRQALERAVADLPTIDEAFALIERGLTEVARRAYIGLGESTPGERSDLLNVLVGVYRARLESLPHYPSERKA